MTMFLSPNQIYNEFNKLNDSYYNSDDFKQEIMNEHYEDCLEGEE